MEENRELSPPELSPTKPRRSRLCPARAGSVLMNALHAEHSLRESHAVSPAREAGTAYQYRQWRHADRFLRDRRRQGSSHQIGDDALRSFQMLFRRPPQGEPDAIRQGRRAILHRPAAAHGKGGSSRPTVLRWRAVSPVRVPPHCASVLRVLQFRGEDWPF